MLSLCARRRSHKSPRVSIPLRSAQLEFQLDGFYQSRESYLPRPPYRLHGFRKEIRLADDRAPSVKKGCAATEWRLLTQEVTFSYKGRYKVFFLFKGPSGVPKEHCEVSYKRA